MADNRVRCVFTGDLYSVQVFIPSRAPGSGWKEVARLDDEGHARWFANRIGVDRDPNDAGYMSPDEAEDLGEMLSLARRNAHENGVATGIARERKRKEGRDG